MGRWPPAQPTGCFTETEGVGFVLVEEKLIYAQFEIFDHFSPTVFSMTRATHSWTDVSSAVTTIRRRG